MTVSRSFAPIDDRDDDRTHTVAPPVFPVLPYAYMAYAEHCSRDYAGYVDKLAHADEPWAEEALGLQMLSDMNQAFFDLVWGPLEAALGAARG